MYFQVPAMNINACFLCGQKSEVYHPVSDGLQLSLSHIIRQHFWFGEDELRTANICESCRAKVDEFHRFYQEVKQHHEGLSLEPQSFAVFIKQEEIDIDEEPFEECGTKTTEEAGEPVDGGCKVEVVEECNELPDGANNVVAADSSKIRKETSTEAKSKPMNSWHRRGCVSRERELAEDNFIKQHRPYDCDECPMQFDRFVTLRRHKVEVHDKNYIVCCNIRYINRTRLHEHVQHVRDPDAFKCDICSKKFKNKNACIIHKLRWHPTKEQLTLKCTSCPKMFAREADLRRHLAEHKTLENEEAKCHICGKCFGRPHYLKDHIEVMHKKNTRFVCEVCSEPFVSRVAFHNHRLRHDVSADQMKKQCLVCNKWQRNLSAWKRHMTRHENEGAYKCDQCDLVSVNLFALNDHVERQHGAKNRKYVCDLCGKEYSQAVTLKEHIANAHTGKPLYKCTYCDRKFFSNASMYAHRKKGHPEEWLKLHNAKYASKEESDGTQQV